MKLWKWFTEDQVKRIAVRLDAAEAPRPIRSDISYYRIRVVEMFLTKKTWMARTWYPALHGSVLTGYDGKEVELPSVADTSKLFEPQTGTGDVIARNFFLTPLLPYDGSGVELACGLFGMQGEDYMAKVVGVLSEFSTLLAVPQLSTALAVAGPLASGVQNLFGAQDGRLHLGYHDSWVAPGAGGDNTFQSGYLAIVRATATEVDPTKLRVVDQSLHLATGIGTKPLTGFDHMLLHVEERTERPDITQLTSFYDPFKKALQALDDQDSTNADALIKTALIAARVSPDLTQADRSRVTRELKQRYQEARADLGFLTVRPAPIPMTPEESLELGVPSVAELLADL